MRILQCRMQRIPCDVKNMERCNAVLLYLCFFRFTSHKFHEIKVKISLSRLCSSLWASYFFSLPIFPHTYRLRQNHWLVRTWIPCINTWGFTRCSNPCVRVATQDVARATYLRFFVAWPYPLFVYVRTILVYEIYF